MKAPPPTPTAAQVCDMILSADDVFRHDSDSDAEIEVCKLDEDEADDVLNEVLGDRNERGGRLDVGAKSSHKHTYLSLQTATENKFS